ncbi:MAG: glutaminase A [Cyanobacteria bacterium J06648_11]
MQSPIQTYLECLHSAYAELHEGHVASYIPELAKANPDWFGICVATSDGYIYEVGDTHQSFTIQSMSKPFTYGLALEDRGRDAVLAKIGVEPTGDAFNSISLAPDTGRPLNPMINAGAIAAASLIEERVSAKPIERLVDLYSTYAGRPLALDRAVYQSEKSTGHRNRAIGHLLRNFDIVEGDPELALDTYFQQCSVAVTCRDLSIMAATLANGGVNPLTGKRAVGAEFVEDILSIMTTCGMYDFAGQWLYAVGMPAKSGVSGGILVVLPGRFGIAVFSPRLDPRGNSVRGVRVCTDLSRDLQLHVLQVARSSRSAIRARYTLADMRSNRRRTEPEERILQKTGTLAQVYELQGDFLLPALETVTRAIVDCSDQTDVTVLYFKQVTRVAEPAVRILCDLLASFHRLGKHLAIAHCHDHRWLLDELERHSATTEVASCLAIVPNVDAALEWCEDYLLARYGGEVSPAASVTLAQHDLCQGLSPQALSHLEALLDRQQFDKDDTILKRGSSADKLYLLLSGEVSVVVALADGRLRRLSTLAAGMAFGELASVARTTRSADVRADTPVECYALSTAALQTLERTQPAIALVLMQNMLRSAHRMVNRLNQEVASLES